MCLARIPNLGEFEGKPVEGGKFPAIGGGDVWWVRRTRRIFTGYEKCGLQAWGRTDLAAENLECDREKLGQLAGDMEHLLALTIGTMAFMACVPLPEPGAL